MCRFHALPLVLLCDCCVEQICSWRQVIISSVFGKFEVGTPHCDKRYWFRIDWKILGKMSVLAGCWWEVQKCWHVEGKTVQMLFEYLGCILCLSGRKGNTSPLLIQQRDWLSHLGECSKSAPPCDCLIEFQVFCKLFSSVQKAGMRSVRYLGSTNGAWGWLAACLREPEVHVLCKWDNQFFSLLGTSSK